MNSKINFSVNECINTLIDRAKLLPKTERVSLFDARNRVLAKRMNSTIDVPPADNSAMDGYALNSADYSIGLSYKIDQRIQAGSSSKQLRPNTSARIFTGAEIPDGANTVIIQENAREVFDLVAFQTTPRIGDNIRKRGQDIAKGTPLLLAGTRLRPQEIGILASVGVDTVTVYKPLKIGILNTGNELVEPGKPLGKGKIYNSNRYLVDSILRDWGFEVIHEKAAKDTLSATKTALQKLAKQCDIVLSTGGVSVGEEDHIKTAVAALGELTISKVVIKPGKPFAFGDIKGTPFIGLPGNPASVFVTLLILTRPYLFACQGRKTTDLIAQPVRLRANIMRHVVTREEYLRCRLSERGLEMHPNQSSGVLSSSVWGNCLLKHQAGTEITPLKLLEVYLYRDLLF